MTFTQRSSISSYIKVMHSRMTLRLEISVSGVYLAEHIPNAQGMTKTLVQTRLIFPNSPIRKPTSVQPKALKLNLNPPKKALSMTLKFTKDQSFIMIDGLRYSKKRIYRYMYYQEELNDEEIHFINGNRLDYRIANLNDCKSLIWLVILVVNLVVNLRDYTLKSIIYIAKK